MTSGAKPLRTFTSVVAPMLVPSIAAGSIFTFSLSLGDYITPRLVTDGRVTMIGNLIYTTLLAPNQPLAAAYTLWPLLIIVVYLLTMRRRQAWIASKSSVIGGAGLAGTNSMLVTVDARPRLRRTAPPRGRDICEFRSCHVLRLFLYLTSRWRSWRSSRSTPPPRCRGHHRA